MMWLCILIAAGFVLDRILETNRKCKSIAKDCKKIQEDLEYIRYKEWEFNIDNDRF